MRFLLRLAQCLALAGALQASAQTMEPAQRYLLAASRLYQGLEYERALEQVKRARTVTAGVADDAAIARYEGVLLYELGKKDEALAAFREALYLEPDGGLPLKVSPKIADAFETIRAAVKKELAPVLAKRRAEEEDARAEAARAAAAAREAQLRVEAEDARRKADEARGKQLADFARREEEARQAEARLEEARRKWEAESRLEEARQKKANAEAERTRLAVLDRPVERPLLPQESLPSPATVQRSAPLAPFIFGGLTVGAGGVATTFGIFANQQLAAARGAQFQDETVTNLRRAQDSALVTNVALAVAGAAAVATLISLLVGGEPAPPPVSAKGNP